MRRHITFKQRLQAHVDCLDALVAATIKGNVPASRSALAKQLKETSEITRDVPYGRLDPYDVMVLLNPFIANNIVAMQEGEFFLEQYHRRPHQTPSTTMTYELVKDIDITCNISTELEQKEPCTTPICIDIHQYIVDMKKRGEYGPTWGAKHQGVYRALQTQKKLRETPEHL